MKLIQKYLKILSFAVTLSACNFDGPENKNQLGGDTLANNWGRTLESASFKTIQSVVVNKGTCFWSNGPDNRSSVMLYFSSDTADTLLLTFPKGCSYKFPYQTDKTGINVFWQPVMENMCDAGLSEVINVATKKYSGKSFMTLELVNDTLLKATYPFPELRDKLNALDQKRILFPENYFTLCVVL